MTSTAELPWAVLSLDTDRRPDRRHGWLHAVDREGECIAVVRFDGPASADWVDLTLGPIAGPQAVEAAADLVRRAVEMAGAAGADRVMTEYDPNNSLAVDILAATGLDWSIRGSVDWSRVRTEVKAPRGSTTRRNHELTARIHG